MTEQRDRAGTELRFFGAIGGMKIVLPSNAPRNDYGQPKPNGGAELTFTVERPDPPREPRAPYPLSTGKRPAAAGPEPKQGPKEQAGTYKKRVEKWNTASLAEASWIKAEQRHSAALTEWRAQAASFASRLLAYGQLIGLVGALGKTRCEVIVRPAETDMLPGFSARVALLEAPVAVDPAELEADDDYEGDEGDEGDEGGGAP